jgi:hypothetical protein
MVLIRFRYRILWWFGFIAILDIRDATHFYDLTLA